MEPSAPPRIDAEMLRVFLMDRDAPCPGCGYNLRGLAAERCPECARPLALALSARPPLSRAKRRWIIALASVALASFLLRAGVSGFWLVQNWSGFGAGGAFMPKYYAVRLGLHIVAGLSMGGWLVAGLVGLGVQSSDEYKPIDRLVLITMVCSGLWLTLEILDYAVWAALM